MPGSAVCGRCGTSLGLATATIDVHPPRAGRFSKTARRAVPMRRALYSAQRMTGRIERRWFTQTMPELAVLWRLIVPGWSHLYLGQIWRGRLFLWGYLLFLIPGVLLFGSTIGSILIGFAFSVHSSAALDIVMRDTPHATFRQRMAMSIAVSLAVGVLIYWPLWRAVTRFIEPHTITRFSGPFEDGDVVMVHPRALPQVGQVVIYDIPEGRSRGNPHGHGERIIWFRGERIDRIVAGPGDRVQWDGQQLLVNGAASPWLPLEPAALPKEGKLSFAVPADCFLILPTTEPDEWIIQRDNLWEGLCYVKAEDIHGRVFARTQPLWHWRRF